MMKRLGILLPGLTAGLLFAPTASALLAGVTPAPSPLLIEIQVRQCVRLLPTGGREIIINDCSACMIVNITRKRPGIPAPVSRSLNVQPKSTMTVPLLGPGRSRITSVLPCRGEKGAAPNLADDKPLLRKKQQRCVTLKKGKTGQVALVNACRVCKAVLVERQNRFGKGQRQAYKVGPKSVLPIQPKGAAKVGLVGEINCPR